MVSLDGVYAALRNGSDVDDRRIRRLVPAPPRTSFIRRRVGPVRRSTCWPPPRTTAEDAAVDVSSIRRGAGLPGPKGPARGPDADAGPPFRAGPAGSLRLVASLACLVLALCLAPGVATPGATAAAGPYAPSLHGK